MGEIMEWVNRGDRLTAIEVVPCDRCQESISSREAWFILPPARLKDDKDFFIACSDVCARILVVMIQAKTHFIQPVA